MPISVSFKFYDQTYIMTVYEGLHRLYKATVEKNFRELFKCYFESIGTRPNLIKTAHLIY